MAHFTVCPIQARPDVEVIEDVVGVVKVGKGLPVDWEVDCDRGDYQEKAESRMTCERGEAVMPELGNGPAAQA